MKTGGVQSGINRLFFCDCKQTAITAVALAAITASLCLFTGQALGLTISATAISLILVPLAIYLCKQKTPHTPTTPTTPLSPPQENQITLLSTGSGVDLPAQSPGGRVAPDRRFSDEDLSGVRQVLFERSPMRNSISMSNSANLCTFVAIRENSAQQPLEALLPSIFPEPDSSYVSPAPQRNSNKTPASAIVVSVPRLNLSLADPKCLQSIEEEDYNQAVAYYQGLNDVRRCLFPNPNAPIAFIDTIPEIRDDQLELIKENLPQNRATLCRILGRLFFIANFGSMLVEDCTSDKLQLKIQRIIDLCPERFIPIADLINNANPHLDRDSEY